jgi:hypothetical protein
VVVGVVVDVVVVVVVVGGVKIITGGHIGGGN